MRVFKICLLLVILFRVSNVGSAQSIRLHWDNLSGKSNRIEGKMRGENYYISPEASIYHFLSSSPRDGSITLMDNDEFKDVQFRYLAFGDELIYYNKNIPYLFVKVDKEIVQGFAFSEEKENGSIVERKFIKLLYDGLIDKDKYFEEIYSGLNKVLAFHQIQREKTSPYIDKNGSKRDTKYISRTNYFLYSETLGFTKLLHKKRKSMLKGFKGSKKEIKKVFRLNKKVLHDKEALSRAYQLIDQSGLLK